MMNVLRCFSFFCGQYTGAVFCEESTGTLPRNFLSSTNNVTVVFHSDSSPISGSGFQLQWATQGEKKIETVTP